MSIDDSNLTLPQSLEEAENRFKSFENADPLPDVPPALLNSADLSDYARITGMVYPFYEKKLKSASYEVEFLGTVHFVDENGNRKDEKLVDKKPFKLRKNSIVFVFLEAKFHLPNYIAIRFNLKITHVHRGLLLGTGPLVDPGFVGQLLIPLHNLTSEDYVLIGGKGLIWVEFTKLSPHFIWDSRARENAANYVKFPSTKRNADFQTYFNNASNGTPAISSIPGEIKKTFDAVNTVKKWALAGGAALFLSLLGLFFATWDLISSANKNVSDASNTIASIRADQTPLSERISTLERELAVLRHSPENSSTATTITKRDRDRKSVV